jgi:hypothetical protein
MTRLLIVCCDDMPTVVGTRIAHLLVVHRDEIPLELVVAVEAMLDQVDAACRDIAVFEASK